MKLEHIGIAVDDAPATTQIYADLLGHQPYKTETVAREGVRTHFIAAGAAKLELLEALGPDSPVAKHLAKRGPGLHHLAFEVDDVDAHFERMQALGYTPLSEAPRPGADGKRIFFLHPRQTAGVLVEFCGATPTPFTLLEGDIDGAVALGDPEAPALLVLPPPDTALSACEPLLRALEPYAHVLALDAADRTTTRDLAADAADLLASQTTEAAHVLALGAAAEAVAHDALAGRTSRRILVAPAAAAPGAAPTLVVLPAGAADTSSLMAAFEEVDATVAVLPGVTPVPGPADLAVLVPVVRTHLATT